MKLCAHTLVKNEERYIWYAVMSVVEYVDKVMIWDTGSSDRTVEIAKEIKKNYPDKVEVKEIGEVTPEGFTKARQEMIEETKADWIFILDGDEVWWENSIKKIVKTIKKGGKKLETIVNRSYLPVGDIFHYQEETAGMYEIDGIQGHLTIRAMSMNIPGLNVSRPHGTQGFFDGEDTLVQDRPKEGREFLDVYNMHLTHLPRSRAREYDKKVPKRAFKLKHELGIPFSKDFYYPEVFFRKRPSIVPEPWERMSLPFYLKSAVLTLPRKIKRRIFKGASGY